ncbi:beta strand repeat-containing protein [Undibacterium curvum]|uniref:Pilus assembly protein N-terminal domain-containing protein n=1 Tax=Undibacterium curvum TaxID=2762294 RepID=A0ABR7A249_9BURK|nr:pilus assembly protein N-terminal domain-containing protein [Undibacterium curvum]MBC3930909.1 pilus assembly protein N-terminal domain-containing protein [Undibacterium curvum]
MATFFRFLTGLFLSAFLAACGGGGGSAGNNGSGGANVPLFTSSPTSISLIPGETATYTIGGGTPNYIAAAGNSAVLVSVKDKTLSITAVASGTSTVTVTDNVGAKLSISVNIGTGIPLFTTAPSSVNIGVGSRTSSFIIGGGSAVYAVSVDNPSIAAVSSVGNQFSVIGLANGSAVVNVVDSLGASVKISVLVGSATAVTGELVTTAPATVKLGVSSSSTFTISGGTAPYFAGSGDNTVATATVVGNILTINGIANGNTTVKVQDSNSKSVTISMQVGNALGLFSSAPSDITVGTGANSPAFTIGGGTPPYSVVAANSLIATAAMSASGNNFIVTGVSAGSTIVTLKDSVGAPLAINVTVSGGTSAPLFTTAPSAITLQSGLSASYTVGGGVPKYDATSSNPAVLSAVQTGTDLTLKALSAGTANVVISDSKGTRLGDIVVTVSGGTTSNLFSTAPSTVAMAIGASPSYSISGGVAPYTVISSNLGVVSVAPVFPLTTNSIFTLTGVGAGSGSIRITDSVGTKLDIAVNVTGSSTVDLATSAPATVNLGVAANVNYSIIGGVGPYFIEPGDKTLVNITRPSTNTFQLTGVAAGSTKIFISDSAGKKILFDVVVLAATSQAMVVSPNSVSLANVGDVLYFRVDGGNPPYTVISNNPAAISITSGTVLSSSGVFTAYMANTGTAVSIVVSDSKGVTQTVSIASITAATGGMFLTPQKWSIDETNNVAVTLTLTGGVAPYQVFNSSTLLASVVATTNGTPSNLFFNDRILTVNVGTQGTRCVNGNQAVTFTVVDSLNRTTTSTMTIVDRNGGAGC